MFSVMLYCDAAKDAFCRSLIDATYFNQTQTVALTVFGITAGFAMRFIRRYKVCHPFPSISTHVNDHV